MVRGGPCFTDFAFHECTVLPCLVTDILLCPAVSIWRRRRSYLYLWEALICECGFLCADELVAVRERTEKNESMLASKNKEIKALRSQVDVYEAS